MRNLFDNLLSLTSGKDGRKPTEDFFTEIVVYIIRNNRDILLKLLNAVNIGYNNIDEYHVETRRPFPPIRDHKIASYPDIYMELHNQGSHNTIFFESKIGSREHSNQLIRYAEQLDELADVNHCWLVYITRDYDRKNNKIIFKRCRNRKRLHFVQIRWSVFYEILKEFENDAIVSETLLFMRKMQMSEINQFSPIDIVSMNTIFGVSKKLDNILDRVKSDLTKGFRGIKKNSRYTQLKNKNRYIDRSDQLNGMWLGIGFWFDSNNINEYPEVIINLA